MPLSPEFDLIDQVYESDEQLSFVGQVFAGDLQRAARSLVYYAKKQVVVIVRAAGRPEPGTGHDTAVPEWDLPAVLADESNWRWRDEGQPAYWVELTERGREAFNLGQEAWESMLRRT